MHTPTFLVLCWTVTMTSASCDLSQLLSVPETARAPWCGVIDKCPAVGQALLSTALNCSSRAVNKSSWVDVKYFCEERKCISSLKELFDASISMHEWITAAQTSMSKEYANQDRRRTVQEIGSAAGKQDFTFPGVKAAEKSAYLASSSDTLGTAVESHLRKCLEGASIEESRLMLPISILTLSSSFLSSQSRIIYLM